MTLFGLWFVAGCGAQSIVNSLTDSSAFPLASKYRVQETKLVEGNVLYSSHNFIKTGKGVDIILAPGDIVSNRTGQIISPGFYETRETSVIPIGWISFKNVCAVPDPAQDPTSEYVAFDDGTACLKRHAGNWKQAAFGCFPSDYHICVYSAGAFYMPPGYQCNYKALCYPDGWFESPKGVMKNSKYEQLGFSNIVAPKGLYKALTLSQKIVPTGY